MKKILVVYLLLVLIKIVLSFSFPSPWVFGDAAIYTAKIKSILAEGNFNFDQYHYGGPQVPPLYSMALLPAYFTSDAGLNHRLMLVLNAFMVTSLIFPAYFLSRRFLKENASFWVAGFASFYPSFFGYSFTVMSENLFLPLTLFAAWIFYETLRKWKLRYEVLMGLLLAALLLTRSAGIFLIASWFFAVVFSSFGRRKKFQYFTRKSIAVVFCLIPLMWWFFAKEAGSGSYDATGYKSSDYIRGFLDIISNPATFRTALSLFFHDVAFLNTATLFFPIPFFMGLFFSKRFFVKKLAPLLWFFFFGAVLFFGVTVVHQFIFSAKLPERYLVFGRYVEPLVPLLLTIGGIAWFSFTSAFSQKKRILLFLIYVTGVVFSLRFLPISEYDIVNNIPILFIRGINFVNEIPLVWIAVWAGIGIFFLFPSRLLKRVFLLGFVFVWMFTYVPAYRHAMAASVDKAQQAAPAQWITRNLPAGSIVLFDKEELWEKNRIQDFWLFEFWMGKKYHLKLADEKENEPYVLSARHLPYKKLFSDGRFTVYQKSK